MLISNFNHARNASGKCVLVKGTKPLPDDNSCCSSDKYWYERTLYWCIPHSSCKDGEQPDPGRQHLCPSIAMHSLFFLLFVLLVPFMFTTLVTMWYYKRSGLATGTIHLPGSESHPRFAALDAGFVETLVSILWFVIGITAVAVEAVMGWVCGATLLLRMQRGYRNMPVDKDTQILHFADKEEL
jgi:hypothetical protein